MPTPASRQTTQTTPDKATYRVIGLMSGTSLDGLDIACCSFTKAGNIWIYKISNTSTIPYSPEWKARLGTLHAGSASDLALAHHLYGELQGRLASEFIQKHGLQPDFIASHGHTIFHQPGQRLYFQLGSGAALAAAAGLPVVCDFRSLDIALGGQGAPLVPIGDQLLFGEYTYCLNLGGIANISGKPAGKQLAYDICSCNIPLNQLSARLGLPYDPEGSTARSGQLNQQLLSRLQAPGYYSAPAPKSLGREWVEEHVLAVLADSGLSIPDQLCTVCHHIALQVAQAVQKAQEISHQANATILVTGGGAFNTFLIGLMQHYLGSAAKVIVPEPEVVNYKEALIFALLGVLRWRNEANCLSSVTGAEADNAGGAIYWR